MDHRDRTVARQGLSKLRHKERIAAGSPCSLQQARTRLATEDLLEEFAHVVVRQRAQLDAMAAAIFDRLRELREFLRTRCRSRRP
jgi:hypothetical protein